MQIEQHSAAGAGRQEPVPNPRGPVSRGPTGESGDLDNMPHVLARIPSLASEPLDDEAEGASPSRLWSSRASLNILAAVVFKLLGVGFLQVKVVSVTGIQPADTVSAWVTVMLSQLVAVITTS